MYLYSLQLTFHFQEWFRHEEGLSSGRFQKVYLVWLISWLCYYSSNPKVYLLFVCFFWESNKSNFWWSCRFCIDQIDTFLLAAVRLRSTDFHIFDAPERWFATLRYSTVFYWFMDWGGCAICFIWINYLSLHCFPVRP